MVTFFDDNGLIINAIVPFVVTFSRGYGFKSLFLYKRNLRQNETGKWRWATLLCIYTILVAWIFAFAAYRLGLLFWAV